MTDERRATWQSGFGKMPAPPQRPSAASATATQPREEQEAPPPVPASRPLSVVSPERAPATPSIPSETETGDRGPALAAAPAAPVAAARVETAPRRAQPRSVTGAQVRAHKVAAGHGRTVADALAKAGAAVDVVEAELTVDRLHVVLRPHSGDTEQVLVLADEVADALQVPDVDCSVDGGRVHVWAALGQSQTSRSAVVWVPNEVREAVQAVRARTGDTVTTIVLNAFNRQAGADGSGLMALFPESAAVTPGPMSIAPRKRRDNLATPAQLWLYLQPAQEVTLDQAVTRTRAGSRSALLTRILEADLGLGAASSA